MSFLIAPKHKVKRGAKYQSYCDFFYNTLFGSEEGQFYFTIFSSLNFSETNQGETRPKPLAVLHFDKRLNMCMVGPSVSLSSLSVYCKVKTLLGGRLRLSLLREVPLVH